MKRTATLILIVLLCGISFLPGDSKIGYIDSEKVVNGYKGMSALKAQYNKLVAEWEEEAQKKKAEIEKLKSELEEQEAMLSEEAKKKKRNEIKQKEKVTSFVKSHLDSPRQTLRKAAKKFLNKWD